MPKTPLAKIPYPSGSDAPAAAEDMMALVMNMDSKLVLPAIDEADRDSKYADAPASSLCVAGPSKKMWMKTGPGPTEWEQVYGSSGWVTEGFVAASGWTIDRVGGINRNGVIDIRAQVTRTGDDIVADSTGPAMGNIADVKILDVPPQFRPQQTDFSIPGIARAYRTSGSTDLYHHGAIMLTDLHTGSSVANGHYVRLAFSFIQE